MNDLREINTRATAKQSPRQRSHMIKEKYGKARNENMQRNKTMRRKESPNSSLRAATSRGKKKIQFRDNLGFHAKAN